MKSSVRILLAALAALHAGGANAQGVERLLIPSPPVAPVANPVQPQAPAPVAQAAPQAPQPSTGRNKRDEAFERAIRETQPMTPDQIRTYRKGLDDTKRAMTTPLSPGKPVSRSMRLTLKPGEETPVIRLQPGIVSTLTFSDVTGQPWPVLSVVTGNPNAYVVQSAGEEGKTNIIVISAIQEWVPSNVVVTLAGYPVPVTMTVEQGRPETDYRVDVRVEARGPNATLDIVGGASLAPTNDSTMIKFLDGTPPQGARKVGTSADDVEAWRFEDQLFVRTRGDVLSPAYMARSSNVSGVNVFMMSDSPVLVVSKDGRLARVRVNR